MLCATIKRMPSPTCGAARPDAVVGVHCLDHVGEQLVQVVPVAGADAPRGTQQHGAPDI